MTTTNLHTSGDRPLIFAVIAASILGGIACDWFANAAIKGGSERLDVLDKPLRDVPRESLVQPK